MNDSAKYFFIKCTELLHNKAFDTYRVSLHNPYTIFSEFEQSIVKLERNQIKRFDPNISSIGEEAMNLVKSDLVDSIIDFNSFSKNQVIDILQKTCVKSKDGKRNRSLSLIASTVLYHNKNFKDTLFSIILDLIKEDSEDNFSKISTYTSWLITQLISEDFSRKFIIDNIRKSRTFVEKGNSIDEGFGRLRRQFQFGEQKYELIFKLRTDSPEDINVVSDAITIKGEFPKAFSKNPWVNEKFKTLAKDECYFSLNINALDFWSALRKSFPIISETIELNILHDFNQQISLDKQVLIIHSDSERFRFTANEEKLDGFYEYCEKEFHRFVDNYKAINEKSSPREKLRSAIRFYKLGNESLELEHKFLNYWIGFEQLFSAVESDEDSIKRIKSFFIPLNAVFYWQRRVNYLVNSLNRSGIELKVDEITQDEIPSDKISDPVLKNRLIKYNVRLKSKGELRKSFEIHTNRLEQHLTRIFRVRNELVHEGKSSVDLFLLTGHLRHYLLFSIEQLTNELNENPALQTLDDVFVYFENLFERVQSAENIQQIYSIKQFVGYME